MPSNPPDAVSGAATPARQCDPTCQHCGEPKEYHRQAGPLFFCPPVYPTTQFTPAEPAATPEAQIPEKCGCGHARVTHSLRSVKTSTRLQWVCRAASCPCERYKPISEPEAQTLCNRIEMFGDEAGGYIFRLESKLAEAESQLASSRTERDRAYAEIEELRFSYKNKSDQIAAARTESTQLRVERDQALEALQNLVGLFRHPSPFYIKKLGGPITNGDQAEIDAAFQKADSLARPIPAEKPDREG